MWLARDKDNNLYLFPYGKPRKGVKTGIFYTNVNRELAKRLKKLADENYSACHLCVRIFETDDRYKYITWENSPVEFISTYKL